MSSWVVGYRLAFHAEHAFAAGQAERVLSILSAVDLPVPAERVQRWESWPQRLAAPDALGPDHPDTLTTRNNLAPERTERNRHE